MIKMILTHNKPPEWEHAEYEDTTYHKFVLSRNDLEYINVTQPFHNCGLYVRTLERVQNPYQLGRLIVRKEQKEFRGHKTDKLTYYHPIHRSDLVAALEYNMDVRRYAHRFTENNVDNKNPRFFKTPGAAAAAICGCRDKVILVCNILGSKTDEPVSTYKTNDSEYMPTYVVALI